MLFAGGQWVSAKRFVAEMSALGVDEWTMVHAFYADSGGFVLVGRDSILFPVTAPQIHYLIDKKYLAAPDITRDEI